MRSLHNLLGYLTRRDGKSKVPVVRAKWQDPSKYTPHQGEREKARRRNRSW